MDIILIPGLWLDASSWGRVDPILEEAGHRAHPLTLPGMESKEADRSRVSRQDHIDAVVRAIDSVDGPVVLVGHSMGSGIAHAAVDSRPDRVIRAIYIGGFPTGDGPGSDTFPSVDGEIPVLDWSDFDDEDLADLDEQARAEFRERAIPSPARVTSDPQRLSNQGRYDVPVTVICTEFSAEMLKGWVDDAVEPVRELQNIQDVTYVDLPTGHWPQFTRPTELARLILDAISDVR
jgi:pimeloyl-ACP methyl ester carboxylesterase